MSPASLIERVASCCQPRASRLREHDTTHDLRVDRGSFRTDQRVAPIVRIQAVEARCHLADASVVEADQNSLASPDIQGPRNPLPRTTWRRPAPLDSRALHDEHHHHQRMAAAEQHRGAADFLRPRPPVLAHAGADAVEIFDLRQVHAAEPAFGDSFDRRLQLAVVELLEAYERAYAGFVHGAADGEEVLGSEADRFLDNKVLTALRRRDRFRCMGVVQRADRDEVAPVSSSMRQ